MLTGLFVGKIFEDISAKYLASIESLFFTSVYRLYLPTNSYQAMSSPFYVIHQTPCFIFLFIVCICYTVKPKFKPNICDYITIISKIMADIHLFYNNYFEVMTINRF